MSKKTRSQTRSKDARRLYKDLAWTWPIISPPKDYIEEGESYRKTILKHSKIPAGTLLNLGCGGGHVDWVLRKYFKITGVDISKDMLRLAKKLNPKVTYLMGDMRKVRLKQRFDVVLIHDSINYMLTQKDLRATFKTGYLHLKPGGLLLTFAEEYDKIVQHKTSFSTHKSDDIEITFIEHYYDPDLRDTTYECTFIYLIWRNKKFEIHTDRHLAGIFPLSTWKKLLKNTGFKVEVEQFEHSEIPKDKYTPEFICIKPF